MHSEKGGDEMKHRPGSGSRMECGSGLRNKLNVNEEYMEAFRSKSFLDVFSKVQGQLSIETSLSSFSSSSSSSSSSASSLSSLPLYTHLSEFVLEPRQETLIDLFKGSNLQDCILVDYFEASLKACNICELLLQSIHQTRENYRTITKIIKQSKRVLQNSTNYTNDQCASIFRDLASYTLLENSLTAISPSQFRDVRDSYKVLFNRLTSRSKKIKRQTKLIHSIVGILAAPGLVGFTRVLPKKGTKMEHQVGSLRSLDVAAKGVYILINDFDTMSRLVQRLHDQVEHSKAIAGICVRNGKSEVLREVMKEFDVQESCFLDQLEELEEHIYLCFVNINRSRRLVLQEISTGILPKLA
ncbi:UPF0496 protein At1g20180 isoform X2 [Malania oleifera]|uniref:UPF0496 protein At1g20180 isoform X2 n=1 Tax=Malania oleifera TaxID=397392 RepID=UPI0025AEBBE5|nr:UPF0496 protein At1g20180 isoform X2 [Malania oleifera]